MPHHDRLPPRVGRRLYTSRRAPRQIRGQVHPHGIRKPAAAAPGAPLPPVFSAFRPAFRAATGRLPKRPRFQPQETGAFLTPADFASVNFTARSHRGCSVNLAPLPRRPAARRQSTAAAPQPKRSPRHAPAASTAGRPAKKTLGHDLYARLEAKRQDRGQMDEDAADAGCSGCRRGCSRRGPAPPALQDPIRPQT